MIPDALYLRRTVAAKDLIQTWLDRCSDFKVMFVDVLAEIAMKHGLPEEEVKATAETIDHTIGRRYVRLPPSSW